MSIKKFKMGVDLGKGDYSVRILFEKVEKGEYVMGTYETGFKVVKKQSLVSAIIQGKDCTLQYKVNKWIKSRKGCGPLCVFNTIENAKDFKWDNHTIYECLYEKSNEHKVYCGNEERSIFSLPQGTVLATKVKLIRRIR